MRKLLILLLLMSAPAVAVQAEEAHHPFSSFSSWIDRLVESAWESVEAYLAPSVDDVHQLFDASGAPADPEDPGSENQSTAEPVDPPLDELGPWIDPVG